MSKILVVDDTVANRELVVSLLRHRGHEALEAGDGVEALRLVRQERPVLVISDILMPVMDGYEFVRELRADPTIAHTDVIFFTAFYREREATKLAEACGVRRVLTKPAEPEDILRAIDEVLQGESTPEAPPIVEEFDREHLRLVTDKLSEKVSELQASNQRFAALFELNLRLASERDPHDLLANVCVVRASSSVRSLPYWPSDARAASASSAQASQRRSQTRSTSLTSNVVSSAT